MMDDRSAFERQLAREVTHMAGPEPPFDPLALARSAMATSPVGRRSVATRLGGGVTVPLQSSPSMVSALKVVAAAAIVALFGGLLLINMTPMPRSDEAVPAAVTTSPTTIFVCPPGSNPDEPGPIDQARPRLDAPAATMAFDRHTGRLVALVDVDDDVETWTFDVCTNTWTQMHPDREPFGWVRLVYDIDSDLTLGIASCINCPVKPTGIVWTYDREANAWTDRGDAPHDAVPVGYDPVSDLVIAATESPLDPKVWTYDAATDTWTPIHQANEPSTEPGWRPLAYDTSVDRIIAYGDGTWRFDMRTGAWSKSGTETPEVWGTGWWGSPPAIAYDEAAERTVVFGSGRLAAYDATADRWDVLVDEELPQPGMPTAMVYDPVNQRLVGLSRGDAANDGGVIAFDTRTAEWIVLLEPGLGQLAPNPEATP